MPETTPIIFYVDARVLLVGTVLFFVSLLTIVWKGKKEIADTIKDAIGDFKERFISMENKMEILWKDEIAPANSPRQLNQRGETILNESGIKEIIDSKRDTLLELVKEKETTNPYDAEKAIEDVMMMLPKHCPDIVDRLKQGAFSTGTDIPSVLFAGSIYLRNLIFPDLGFSLDDLDKPKQ